jgi:excisionase family DNA binding protein
MAYLVDPEGRCGICRSLVADFLTADEVATALRLHPRTVRRMLADGRLPGTKVGGKAWRVSRRLLVNLVEGEQAQKELAQFLGGSRY